MGITIYSLIVWLFNHTKLYWYIYPLFPAMAACIGIFSAHLIKLKKLSLSVLLILLVLFSFYQSEKMILRQVKVRGTTDVQTVFQPIDRNPNYKKAHVFAESSIGWSQSTHLAALLYGDLVPQKTGIAGFTKDRRKNSLLLLEKKRANEKRVNEAGYRTIAQNKKYFLVTK
ncbi:hypothetical protein [Sporolactobacillus inulinus]|uniref:hypothetical protein n=1 Tax=Sporolactobacillus inulinus TaxID=2078 RepID=UPI000309FE4A|nr:hypothetical protein [Sporolactobacillus inulinus]GEB77510.1 hypothetical protein SIN01_18550 [Sporolactobacillus inulinus]